MAKSNPSKFKPSPEQQAILESKGDTMVVSNPGTGKTTTLSLKVIDLLENGANPEEILCITFTTKAKKEMFDKIFEMSQGKFPDADILKIKIHTFHAFAYDYLTEAGLISSEVLGNNILRYSILESFIENKALNWGKSYIVDTIMPKVENSIRKIKSFGITPDKIDMKKTASIIQQNFKPTRAFSKDDIKAFLTYYVEAYKHYENSKKDMVDYSDMLLTFLEKFQGAKYEHVLVDEMQDMNGIQAQIIEMISKNLFLVGDAKQAIFGFQGGSIKNFQKFAKSCKSMLLSTNRRSTQQILDYSKRYFLDGTEHRTKFERELKNFMSENTTKVIVTRRLPEIVEARMMELFDTKLNADDHPFSSEELVTAVDEADILVPTVTDKIDKKTLDSTKRRIKMIANFGTGVDHIDLEYAEKNGLIVTNTPGVLTEDTADMVMALLLSVPRKLIDGERLIRSGEWQGWSPTHMMGSRIWGKRLGIIGMGRIGQAVARRANGFGLNIHYHNRNRLPEVIEKSLKATFWEDIDQMLPKMDIISINCPSTPETYHLLSLKRLLSLQSHAYIVNTSRGKVIDEDALAKLLKEKKIAGAGLDVFEREPAVGASLLDAPNTVLLPHMGSSTVEARNAMGEKVIINIQTFIDGHKPPDRVLSTILGI